MDQTNTLGQDVRINTKDQAARWLLGTAHFVMKKLGEEEFDWDEFIQSLAEAGVTPEADGENNLYQLATDSLTARKLYNPNLAAPAESKGWDQEAMNRSIAIPSKYVRALIYRLAQGEDKETIYQEAREKGLLSQLRVWEDRSRTEQQTAEAQAYGYLMAMINLGILDADHAGELMEDYRPGRKYNP